MESESGELTPVSRLRTEMDRLFETFLREPFRSVGWPLGSSGAWMPALDVAETDQEVIVRAEIPGVDPKDLDVSVTGDVLVVAGEKSESTERKEKNYYHSESHFGSFRRSIQLPTAIDPEKITAEYANGVATIRLAKKLTATPRKIEVKTAP
jgi:HSP20 family protein